MKSLSLKLMCVSVIFIFCLVPLAAMDYNQDTDLQNVKITDGEGYFINVNVDDVNFGENIRIKVDTNVPDSTLTYRIYQGSTCLTGHEMNVKSGHGYGKMKDLLPAGKYTIKVVYINDAGNRFCVGTDDFEVIG